jgi:hypothetical protein
MNNIDLLKNYLAKELGYSDKLVDREAERFYNNDDILAEFSYYLNNGKFSDVPVTVQDYSAELLYKQYRKIFHTVYDAYSYLILLREKPEYALKIMRRNFPEK